MSLDSLPSTMRAVGINQYGDINAIEQLELPLPKLKPNEILVKVRLECFIGLSRTHTCSLISTGRIWRLQLARRCFPQRIRPRCLPALAPSEAPRVGGGRNNRCATDRRERSVE